MNMKGYILLASLLLPAALMAQPATSGQYTYTGAPVNLTEHTFKCDHLLKFHGTDKEGAPLEQVKRIELEAKVITMMNSIKHESEDEESRSLLGDSLVNRVN